MSTIVKRIVIILLTSGMLAMVANRVHPRKIPWVQDWSNQVEAKARDQQIKVISLSVALHTFMIPDRVFIDARTSEEFSDGHIPGALSVPLDSVDEQFELISSLLDSGKELVVYCQNRDCDDSLLLATELQVMGASNLVLYVDGYELWKKYGGAVEIDE